MFWTEAFNKIENTDVQLHSGIQMNQLIVFVVVFELV